MQKSGTQKKSRLALCKRNLEGVVLSQNKECLRLCENRGATVCLDGCSVFLSPMEQGQMQIHENVILRGECCNLVAFDIGDHRYTAIESHDSHFRELFSKLKDAALTVSEEKVMKMKIAGFTNRQIADELFVTVSTVKTHLLHAYRKITPKKVAELKKR